MLNITGSTYKTCDGLTRRSFLKAGFLALGGMTLAGSTFGSKPAPVEQGEATSGHRRHRFSGWAAASSHIDMYDLKPNAPAEFRGEFREIDSNVPGIRVGEHLPLQSRLMDKMSVVRSVTHTNPGHGMGSHWMLTAYVPTIEINDNLNPCNWLGGGAPDARGQPAAHARLCLRAERAGPFDGRLFGRRLQSVRAGG